MSGLFFTLGAAWLAWSLAGWWGRPRRFRAPRTVVLGVDVAPVLGVLVLELGRRLLLETPR